MSGDRLRLAVTGLKGQVVSALIAHAPRDVEMIALGRPQFDLAMREAVLATLKATRCDAIINTAAYTAVDMAENEPDVAMQVNGAGAGFVAEAAQALGVPLLHVSTDYVFDGMLDRPYHEDDPTNPQTAYGRSKLEGEEQIKVRHDNHVILRTAWIYGPEGANFAKTMLRLGETLPEVQVVADQFGNPTAARDIAAALFLIARRLVDDRAPDLRGIYHMTGATEASWAAFARHIFSCAQDYGRAPVTVKEITTADYPTPARRPANSRLDNRKLRKHFDVSLPEWRASVKHCVGQILTGERDKNLCAE